MPYRRKTEDEVGKGGPPVVAAFRYKPDDGDAPARPTRRFADSARGAGTAHHAGASSGPSGYILVKGLPYTATPEDVAKAFQNFRIPLRNIYMGVHNSGNMTGRSDGQAFVKVPDAHKVDTIVQQLDGVTVGARYLNVFASDAAEFNEAFEDERLLPPSKSGSSSDVPHYGRTRNARDDAKGGHKGKDSGARHHREAPPRDEEKGGKSGAKGKGKGTDGKDGMGKDGKGKDGKGKDGKGKDGKGKGKGKDREEREFPQPSDDDGVIRIRGVPFSITIPEIVNAFAKYGIDENDVFLGLICTGPRAGQPDGQAFINFGSAKVAKNVERQCQGMLLCDRYLEVFQSSEEDLEFQVGRGSAAGGENPYEVQGAGYVRLRGLPYDASKKDIVNFFGPSYGLVEDDVTIRYNHQFRRPSGEAYVLMNSEESAIAAQKALDKECIGKRFVDVFISSATEVYRFTRPTPYTRARC